MRTRLGLAMAATLTTLLAAQPAHAAHHLWTLQRAFSNASGSVQYVELFTTDGSETQVAGQSVTDNGTGTLPSNLTGSTAGQWLLLATANFQSLTGVHPDATIPANFLSTGGGSAVYAGLDTWAYGALPTDGSHMLLRTGATAPAVATNFGGPNVPVALVTAAPAAPPWAIALAVGALLLAGSGLLRKREPVAAP
jgi:hypothetical protein